MLSIGFHHTGDLENFNSLGNKYRAKGYVFGYDGMVARTALACIDHNSNIGREQVCWDYSGEHRAN